MISSITSVHLGHDVSMCSGCDNAACHALKMILAGQAMMCYLYAVSIL